MCQVMAVKHVAHYLGMGWDQVKGIDKRWLRKVLNPVDLSGVQVIAMDEFAIHKGQRYATIIVEAPSKGVLWVGRGAEERIFGPFLDSWVSKGAQQSKRWPWT